MPQSGYGYQQQPSQQPRIVSGNVSAAHAVTAVAVTPGQSLQDTPLATVASIRGGSSDVFATVVSASSTPVSASGYAGSISSARPPQPQYPNALGSIKAAPISSTPLVAPLRTNSSTSNTSTASGFQKQSSQFGLMEVVSDPPTRVNSLSKGNSSSFATSSKSEPESPFMEIPTSPTTFPILKGKTEAELEVLLADSKAFKDLVESIVCEDPNVDYLESMRDETRKANLSQAEATLQLVCTHNHM